MPSDNWNAEIFGSLRASAATQERALNYQERSAHFREMAEAETDYELRSQLLYLAAQYDELAREQIRRPQQSRTLGRL